MRIAGSSQNFGTDGRSAKISEAYSFGLKKKEDGC